MPQRALNTSTNTEGIRKLGAYLESFRRGQRFIPSRSVDTLSISLPRLCVLKKGIKALPRALLHRSKERLSH